MRIADAAIGLPWTIGAARVLFSWPEQPSSDIRKGARCACSLPTSDLDRAPA